MAMNFTQMSEELCQLHIRYAGAMNQMLDGISARGEDGVVLWLYQRGQETFSTDVIQHFHLSPGRVANILKKMEQKKLVERRKDAEDQRKARILLTEEGRAYADQSYAEMVEEHRAILEALGGEEAEQLLRLIKHILTMVDSGQISSM